MEDTNIENTISDDNPDFVPDSAETPPVVADEPQKLSNLAIVSFVLALSTCGMSCLTAIPAIIVAFMAFKEIDESNGRLGGRNFAKAAIVIAIIFFIIQCILFVFNILVTIATSGQQ